MLSPDQLIKLIGTLDKLEWRNIRSSSLGCVDWRHSTSGLYAYGGDFGELLLALTVYEHMVQRKLTQVPPAMHPSTHPALYQRSHLSAQPRGGGSLLAESVPPTPIAVRADRDFRLLF